MGGEIKEEEFPNIVETSMRKRAGVELDAYLGDTPNGGYTNRHTDRHTEVFTELLFN